MKHVKNVLVIDDDEAIIKLFEFIGHRMSIKILTAKDGSDAYTKFRNQQFDLVLTDLDLPKLNGVEFIKKVRREPKNANYPFIIITGKFSMFKQELKKMPNLTMLEKPLKVSAIQNLFRTRLDACLKEEEIVELSDVEERMLNGFKIASTFFLDFTTNDRPKVTKVTEHKSLPYPKANYVANYPVVVGGNPLSFYFTFDKSLASTIKNSIIKDKKIEATDNAIIVSTLKKLMQSFIKKTFDISGFFLGVTTRGHNSILGSYDASSRTWIDNTKLLCCYTAKNKYGSLTMYILKEN